MQLSKTELNIIEHGILTKLDDIEQTIKEYKYITANASLAIIQLDKARNELTACKSLNDKTGLNNDYIQATIEQLRKTINSYMRKGKKLAQSELAHLSADKKQSIKTKYPQLFNFL